jgi:hypothetical protein
MTPEISRDLCGLAPAAAQLLSPVDACVSFGQRVESYLTGAPSPSSLFDTPLLKFSEPSNAYLLNPPQDLKDFLNTHLGSTPILQTHLPHLERPHPTHGAPFLELSEIDAKRVKQALVRDPTQQAVNQDPERIAALVALDIDVRKSAAAQKSTVGTMQRRDNGQIETFEANLKMETPPNCSIAVEEALYPMLFPDGKGGKPDGYPLSDYLEYRISQFFSPSRPHHGVMFTAKEINEIMDLAKEDFTARVRKVKPLFSYPRAGVYMDKEVLSIYPSGARPYPPLPNTSRVSARSR